MRILRTNALFRINTYAANLQRIIMKIFNYELLK